MDSWWGSVDSKHRGRWGWNQRHGQRREPGRGRRWANRTAAAPSLPPVLVLLPCLAAFCVWPCCHPPCHFNRGCIAIKRTLSPPSVSVSLLSGGGMRRIILPPPPLPQHPYLRQAAASILREQGQRDFIHLCDDFYTRDAKKVLWGQLRGRCECHRVRGTSSIEG